MLMLSHSLQGLISMKMLYDLHSHQISTQPSTYGRLNLITHHCSLVAELLCTLQSVYQFMMCACRLHTNPCGGLHACLRGLSLHKLHHKQPADVESVLHTLSHVSPHASKMSTFHRKGLKSRQTS